MRVRITPVGRDPFVAECGEPAYSDAAVGGYDDATVAVQLSAQQRERIISAQVMLLGAYGPVWGGEVWDFSRSSLSCSGEHVALGRKFLRRAYRTTRFLGDLKDFNGVNWGAFRRSNSGGTLNLGQSPATTCAASDQCGYYYWGSIPWQSLSFDAYIAHADVSIKVYTSATEGAATTEVLNVTSTATDRIADLAGAYGFVVVVNIDAGPSTPSRYDKYVTLSDLALYGVSGVTSATPGNVLTNALAGYDLGHVATDETTEIDNLDNDGSIASILTAVREYTGRNLGFRYRDVSGLPAIVPIYEARPTTAAYRVDVGSNHSLRLGSLSALRSKVEFRYSDADGNKREGSVSATSGYLYDLGIEYTELLNLQTTSLVTAGSAANAWLDAHKDLTATGTIPVVGSRLTTAGGVPVSPSRIEAGQLVSVTGDFGTATGYISRVDHQGESAATLTLDDANTISAALKRITGA